MEITEAEALANAVKSTNISGLEVWTYFFEDKRKASKYYLSIHGGTCSPVLDYDQLNHFILGMIQAKKILTNEAFKRDIRLWAGSDTLPTCSDYKRYLDEAEKQLKISRQEARNKYGQFTYGQWKELLKLF